MDVLELVVLEFVVLDFVVPEFVIPGFNEANGAQYWLILA